MKMPIKLVELRQAQRSEFHLMDGYQPTHAFFYLKEGSFEVEIDGKKEKVTKGDCYIIPDYIHFHRKVIEPIEFIYIKFATNECCPYSLHISHGKAKFKDEKRVFSNMAKLESLLMKEDALSIGYCEHLLLDILFQLHYENHQSTTFLEEVLCRDALVCSAIEYINQNLNRKILIEEICKNVATNSSTLNFKFRRELNQSIGQFVINQRIQRAKKLLITTTYSISEIAERCGFEDVSYFSNNFKKIQGVSPSQYRGR